MKSSSELKQLAQSIDSLETARTLLASTEEEQFFISIHNEFGKYLEVSNSFSDISGYSKKEVIGTSAYDYFNGDDLKAILLSHAATSIKPDVSKVKYRLKSRVEILSQLLHSVKT